MPGAPTFTGFQGQRLTARPTLPINLKRPSAVLESLFLLGRSLWQLPYIDTPADGVDVAVGVAAMNFTNSA